MRGSGGTCSLEHVVGNQHTLAGHVEANTRQVHATLKEPSEDADRSGVRVQTHLDRHVIVATADLRGMSKAPDA
jgi:hypothetical protein